MSLEFQILPKNIYEGALRGILVLFVYNNIAKDMKLKLLLLRINAYYEANDITETKNGARFYALDKVANYIRSLYGEGNPDIDELMKVDKTFVRNDYEKKKEKPLSGAEKQVFNDIYKVYCQTKDY